VREKTHIPSRVPPNSLGIKSLLGTEFLEKKQIEQILKYSFLFKDLLDSGKPVPQTLSGKTVILLFFEPSTRTRSSFELAAKRLGGNTLALSKEGSSTEKGETLIDTAKTVQAMNPDLLVLRHPSAGSPFHLDQTLDLPVINAGDGFHEHPTQALLDLMTIQQFKGKIEGLKVEWPVQTYMPYRKWGPKFLFVVHPHFFHPKWNRWGLKSITTWTKRSETKTSS
jgi:aspartate carbamoyltransferase catalytic subunit